MKIALDILISVILLLAGYVYTCYYFNNVRTLCFDKKALKITHNKILYLVVGAFVAGILIALFENIYSLSAINQIKLLSLTMIMLPIAAVDMRVQKVPNKLLIGALLIRIAIYIAEFICSVGVAWGTLKDNLLGSIVIGGFFLLLLLIFKNSIGMGDIKLFAIMGLYQGLWGAVNSVFFSLLVSFVVSVILLATKKKGRKDTISFGPSIFIGTVIAMGLAGM